MDKALPRYGGAGIKSGVTQVTPLLHVKTPQGRAGWLWHASHAPFDSPNQRQAGCAPQFRHLMHVQYEQASICRREDNGMFRNICALIAALLLAASCGQALAAALTLRPDGGTLSTKGVLA